MKIIPGFALENRLNWSKNEKPTVGFEPAAKMIAESALTNLPQLHICTAFVEVINTVAKNLAFSEASTALPGSF